ncbi:MAG: dihydroorotase [Actinomycetota bacterium]
MDRVLFRGGRLLDPVAGVDRTCDVAISGGRIEEVGPRLHGAGAWVIDIPGAVIAPGLVDCHVHLREPGREDEETIASGSAAAAMGGFTAICAMPNTDPVCDNAAVAEKVFGRGGAVGLTEVVVAGALTRGLGGEHLAAIGEMATCAARVRIFTDDGKGVQNARLLRRAMEYVKGFGAVCAEHCEEASLSEGGQMNEGEVSSRLGLKGIPAEAEEIALARDLALARLTGVRFHALHISTAGSVELIRRAKAEGQALSAEATPHHAVLTDAALAGYDPNFKVNPPLRSSADVEAVRAGLADGTIDAIATDHAPHALQEKEGDFETAPPGMLGLETALGVVLTELVTPGVLTLAQAISRLAVAPARILGVEGQGGPVIAGAVANLVIFDPEARWVVEPARLVSLSANSPWAGRVLTGRVLYTVLGGRVVVEEGRLATRSLARQAR